MSEISCKQISGYVITDMVDGEQREVKIKFYDEQETCTPMSIETFYNKEFFITRRMAIEIAKKIYRELYFKE